MLAEILNTQFRGYEAWKILLAVACLGILTVVSWAVTLLMVWRSPMPRNEKLLVSCVLVVLGPFGLIQCLIVQPWAPFEFLIYWSRGRHRRDGDSHSLHVRR